MNALCSVRVLSPFLRVIGAQDASRDLMPNDFLSAAPDDRVSLAAVHSLLENAVERLGNEQLGLKVGKTLCLGEAGLVDYMVKSAATLREAVETAGRYSVLHADSYRVLFELWRGRGLIRVLDEVWWPRSIADFTMSATYKLHVREQVPLASPLECWFPYAEPRDLKAYAQAFAGATLKFNAPFYAFAFNGAYERTPQASANPMLHALLRERLDSIVAEIACSFAIGPRMRRVIEQQIRQARHATAPAVARALHMSRRTLSRKLEQEGTTFSDELDSVRHQLALSYVRESQRPLAEVAFLLGFSHVESFYRAFKRWTGATPFAYRAKAG
jgi:AraC-like DNA-binding protein